MLIAIVMVGIGYCPPQVLVNRHHVGTACPDVVQPKRMFIASPLQMLICVHPKSQ